jgi:hypothetical protein
MEEMDLSAQQSKMKTACHRGAARGVERPGLAIGGGDAGDARLVLLRRYVSKQKMWRLSPPKVRYALRRPAQRWPAFHSENL